MFLPSKRDAVARVLLSGLVALLGAASAAAQSGCVDPPLGVVPARWIGNRLAMPGRVDGDAVTMIVDTGSSATLVSAALADRLHLQERDTGEATLGFGGRAPTRDARVDTLSFGRFEMRESPVRVMTGTGADFPDVLLGAATLFEHDVELGDDGLTFYAPPPDCGDAPPPTWPDDAAWVPMDLAPGHDRHVVVTVLVDGEPVRALVDTGAPDTMLDLGIARRLGFDPAAHEALQGRGHGIGRHVVPVWTATFDSIAVGTEIVRPAPIFVTELWAGVTSDVHSPQIERWLAAQPRMILGADFLRVHRVLFSVSQHRLYFSFTGGDVFRHVTGRAAAAAPSTQR